MNEIHTHASGACRLAGCTKRILLATAAIAAAAVLAGPATAHEFNLNMSGDQEVPGPGDPDGFATGTIYVEPLANGIIAWNITFANIAAPTMMHIHIGDAEVAGPVLVNLGVATSGGPGTLIGNTTTSAAIAQVIVANPTGFYVNIHNADFPDGAVRGQIELQPLVDFFLDMDGAQEVPGPGDEDGTASGTLTIDPTKDTISWSLTYTNIDAPTQMHIHTGAAGVAGPVLINLGIATSGGPGTLIGSTVTFPGFIELILSDPAGHYVNIHNQSFPDGAVRGQLLAPCPADIGEPGDGVVGAGDLAQLLADWGDCPGKGDCVADLFPTDGGDGVVGAGDLGQLLGSWGQCP